jgi:DNA invertase Pin-like site-specific DNA recombinase
LLSPFAAQALIVQRLAILWLITVFSGYLRLFGVGFSTLSAHPLSRQTDLVLPPTASLSSGPPRRRRQGASSPGNSSEADGGPWASYARYSSDNQREESITDQQRKCREAAARNGHRIPPELEFADEAVSGTKLHRAGLDTMLAAAAGGQFAGLYFHSLSRLARESVITMPMLKKLVYVDGVRVISVTEGIDSDRDGWDLMATIFSVLHERYLKDLSDNVFRGQEGTVLAGLCAGDYCFGYTSVPIPGSEQGRKGRHAKPRMAYAIDERTAPWVLRIFHWFVAEKRSLRWITQELNRLGAPKDHRATTKHWHHQQVAELLRRPKYVGVWPWGEAKNVRNPLTGQVSQAARPEEECAKWTRSFPHLRIISDELWEAAQARLAENARQQEHRRRPDGRLAGSETGNAAAHPRHLLSGLLRCEACGATFRVAGAGGKYLRCPNWAKGVCACKTQVRRDRAERMILEAVGQRVLGNPAWLEAVLAETLAAWREQQQGLPEERRGVEKLLAEVERKIAHLVDSIEAGHDSPEVRSRLAQRRDERQALGKRLEQLQRTEDRPQPEPTPTWVAEQLGRLTEVLTAGGPAAAHALRDLVGGRVTVREVRRPGRQRHHLQARFVIRSRQLLNSLGIASPGREEGPPASAAEGTEEVVLDLRDPTPDEQVVDQVKALWDDGLTYREIADRVGWNRNIVAAAVARWHRERGLEPPDGRSCKTRLNRKTLPEELAEEAKALWDQDLLLQEIAARLGCNRDTVSKAIKHWFESRGLEVPDGRVRRKGLPRKCSRDEDGEEPEGGDVGAGAS